MYTAEKQRDIYKEGVKDLYEQFKLIEEFNKLTKTYFCSCPTKGMNAY